MSESTKKMLSGIAEIARSVQTYVPTGLIQLHDTPTGYQGHSGDYLVVSDNESGIHFAGIEKIATDLTNYGFGGGGGGLSDTSVVPEVYDSINSLPLAINQDGAIVRVGCDFYVSCDGQWKPLVESGSEQLPVSTIPGCIKNINELTLYQAYKDKFIADNSLDSFEEGFNQTFQSLIYDVCLHTEDPANIVKIDETQYKWGIFKDSTEVNISATPQEVSDGSVSFVRWEGVGAVFGNPLDASTTLAVDKDLAITAYFARLYTTARCADVLLFIDATQDIKDLSSQNSEIISEGLVGQNSEGLHFGRDACGHTRYKNPTDFMRGVMPSYLHGNDKTITLQFRPLGGANDGYIISLGNTDHYVTIRIYEGKIVLHIGDPGTWGTNIGTGIVPVSGKWYDLTFRYGSRYDQIAISVDGVGFDWSTKVDSNGTGGGLNTISAIDATSYLGLSCVFSSSSGSSTGVSGDYKNVKIFEGQATDISAIDPTSTSVPDGCSSLLFNSVNGSMNDDTEGLKTFTEYGNPHCSESIDSGQSAVFNSTNQSHISTQLSLHDLTNLSISFWLYWDSDVKGAVVGSTNNNGSANLKSCRQQVLLLASAGRFDYTSRQGDLVRHTISLPDGWHHFAVTDNNSTTPSGAINMYIDGISVSYVEVVSNGNYSTNTNMQIGRTRRNDNVIGNHLTAKLDDLRIYSDILSPAEIQYISRNDRPNIPADNLTAYYKFDGNVDSEKSSYNEVPSSITYTGPANLGFTDHLLLTDKPFASLGTEAYTIEFSLKTDEFQAGGGTVFLSNWEGEKGGCAGSAQYWVISIDGNGFVNFNFRDSGNSHKSSIAINLGVWNHVAITYDGSIEAGESGKTTGYTFWINGEKAGEWGSYIQRSHSDGCVGQINGVVDMGGNKLDTALYEVIGFGSSGFGSGFLGSLKQIRIIKGKSIYNENFTPQQTIENLCE